MNSLTEELNLSSDPVRATNLARFFKTGLGEYGEGDKFIGLTMPQIRAIAKKYRHYSIDELSKSLSSPIHEHRMASLVILADTFKKRDDSGKRKSYELYLSGLADGYINNWDLVDVTAPHVVGEYVFEHSPDILYKLASSTDVWERRTAVLASSAFLKRGNATHTIKLCEMLLNDKHDLMHKAVGWFLREAGKRVDEKILTDFLDIHSKQMPRTMLRYSIEHLTPAQRAYYMQR